MGLSRRQFIIGAAGAGLILLSNPLPKIIPAWGSSLAFGASIKYVSNRTSAGGNGTLSNPYQVSEIWSNAVPGDEFIFLDGLYRGSGSMLDVAVGGGEGESGTAQAWITLRAETDGQVTFDGQFARSPIRLAGNRFILLQGFNARNSSGASVVAVTRFSSGTNVPCSWIQLKRICAWDADITENIHVFDIAYGTNILVEDCAGWGGGRKIFELYSGGSGTSGGYGGGGATLRRCWAEWNKFGSVSFGPQHAFSLSYAYTNVLAENIIGTWNTDSGSPTNNPYDIIGHDGFIDGIPRYVKLYGSLAYLRQNQATPIGQMISFPGGAIGGQTDIRDTMACIESGASHTGRRPFLFGTPLYPVNTVRDCSSIHNGKLSQLTSGWTYTNFSEDGPRSLPLLLKYVDGVKTGTSLLPWPMNQRIIDARIQSGRSAVDVTATVQQVLGSGAGDSTAPQAPENLRAS